MVKSCCFTESHPADVGNSSNELTRASELGYLRFSSVYSCITNGYNSLRELTAISSRFLVCGMINRNREW